MAPKYADRYRSLTRKTFSASTPTSLQSLSASTSLPSLAPHQAANENQALPSAEKHRPLHLQTARHVLKSAMTATAATFSTSLNKVQSGKAKDKLHCRRYLFDEGRWGRCRTSRCDYCNRAGTDLSCILCDIVAHSSCHIHHFKTSKIKHKTTFSLHPPDTADSADTKSITEDWICNHCIDDLRTEHDGKVRAERKRILDERRQALATVVWRYTQAIKDTRQFHRQKAAVKVMQALARGFLARRKVLQMRRLRLKPYIITSLNVQDLRHHPQLLFPAETTTPLADLTPSEEVRLSNGFLLNPLVYVTVVDGNDEDRQLYCYESAQKKASSVISELLGAFSLRHHTLVDSTESKYAGALMFLGQGTNTKEVFLPGMDGNVSIAFTLLSRNGYNLIFLGQSVLRLATNGSTSLNRIQHELWQKGGYCELPLEQEIEIYPKTAQHQPLRLTEITGGMGSTPTPLPISFKKGSRRKKSRSKMHHADSAVNTLRKVRMGIHLHVFRELESYCGLLYLTYNQSSNSTKRVTRWGVLVRSQLKIYRKAGVIIPSDVVTLPNVSALELRKSGICIQVANVNYNIEGEHAAQTRIWYKKIVAAMDL